MWNIDIETRIRDLNAEAENHQARLLDTMTETDGSAKALTRVVERVKRALSRPARRPRLLPAHRGPVASSK